MELNDEEYVSDMREAATMSDTPPREISADERKRSLYLIRTYGIDLHQYRDLLAKQDGHCALCPKTAVSEGQALAVDHDHATGEVRGLLCRYCNHRVVGRHRDAELLRRVADYVERHTGWFVPKKKKKVKPRAKRTNR